MDVVSEIDVNFVLFFTMVIFGTCCVALISGFIAEKWLKSQDTGMDKIRC